ncbi:helix-turn-helix domain-containing protein [Rosettibacter firmus]|uniref:helix-turn-helix domain-containing protein n=1 Tax=Rosettibacter firmus TaxID=3111522 RepID=UPI00336C1C7E
MTKQEEIKYLIHTYGIKLSYIAEKIGIKTQTLNYLLNEHSPFDDELYKKIKEIIDDYQFELNLFDNSYEEDLDLFNKEDQYNIGERLRIFAKKKFGKLKKLAEAMNISPQQLQQYVSGKREPGAKILIKLLKLGCDINWLLGGKESIESYRIYKLETKLRQLQEATEQISQIIKKLD